MLYIFILSAFIILHTYLFYPFLLWILDKFFLEDEKEENTDYFPEVSILIPAFNEEKIIKRKIENLKSLDYPAGKMEVIIASDGSTDNTNQIIEENICSLFKFMRFNERKGKSSILNKLVEEASSSIIVFSDASTIYRKNTLKELIKKFKDPDVGGVCGNLIFINNNLEKISINDKIYAQSEKLYWRFEKFLRYVEGKIGNLMGNSGAVYALRAELVKNLSDRIINDDIVLFFSVLKKDYKLKYQRSAEAYEKIADDFDEEFKRKVRIGSGDYQALSILKELLFKNFKVSFAFWSHKVFRWLTPFALLLLLISNMFLYTRNIFFSITLFLQSAAYLNSLIIHFGKNRKRKSCKTYIIYYFLVMNLALLIGFIKFVFNKHNVKW